jgi:outer membrane protein TolC
MALHLLGTLTAPNPHLACFVLGLFITPMRNPGPTLVIAASIALLLTAASPAATMPKSSQVELLTGAEEPVLTEARGQASKVPARPATFKEESTPARIPAEFQPWWIKGQRVAIGEPGAKRLSLEELYSRALRYSKQIRVFADLPLIRETGVQEAGGAFDTNSFLKTQFDHRNEPVGNTLTTGGASRFREDAWTVESGIKKKTIAGTEITLSQEIGRTDNNSIYFVPNPQSTAKLTLSVVQPLLRGAGISYNRSTMQVARIDSEVAMQEFIRQSESHLLEIARTYWALYAARVTYLQKLRLVDETGHVTDELRGRAGVDTQQTQLFRAQSALASRRSDLVRAEAAIRNAADRLRALTSDPELMACANCEIVPADVLVLSSSPVDAKAASQSALEHRPEIRQAFMQLRAAGIREKVSHNELLPELNLVLQGSLGGLDDDRFLGGVERQYSTGGPGYGVGIVFSIPFENNAARAVHERRQLETRQQVAQVKTTIDTVLLEVKVSVREVTTAYRETQAKYEAVKAFTEDVESIRARRDVQALQDQAQIANYLDHLIDAQDRRAVAEEDFIRAAANYQIAIVNLERAKGRLLSYEDVNIVRTTDEKRLPILLLEKGRPDGKSIR